MRVSIQLVKPFSGDLITYDGELLETTEEYWLVASKWQRSRHDLGLFALETGDVLHEYFFLRRWFVIFEAQDSSNRRKGWYCSVSRPPQVSSRSIISEDLVLDLVVSADARHWQVRDEDEFATFELEASDRDRAYGALDELREMVAHRRVPFAEAKLRGAPPRIDVGGRH